MALLVEGLGHEDKHVRDQCIAFVEPSLNKGEDLWYVLTLIDLRMTHHIDYFRAVPFLLIQTIHQLK
jgi:hypothetical protein